MVLRQLVGGLVVTATIDGGAGRFQPFPTKAVSGLFNFAAPTDEKSVGAVSLFVVTETALSIVTFPNGKKFPELHFCFFFSFI